MDSILSGDIGGTNARLAVFRFGGGAGGRDWEILASKTYPARDFQGLEEVLREFLRETGLRPAIASLGVAGVIRGGAVRMTNLPWQPDAGRIARDLALSRVLFLNDLEAAAWGIEALGPSGQTVLHAGEPDAEGNRCLCSAGTGLGEAGMVSTPAGHLPFHSEGGHVNFAPRDAVEIDLLRHLMAQFGHVSYERVVSGPGLLNVYAFLRDTGRGTEPGWLADRIRGGSPGKVVTECALAGESELCTAAVELFARVYGSAAGNLALKTTATGGVWLGGGIAPSILPFLGAAGFREAFVSKGRLTPVMEKIPVSVVTDDRLALLGAARAGLRTFLRDHGGGDAGRGAP